MARPTASSTCSRTVPNNGDGQTTSEAFIKVCAARTAPSRFLDEHDTTNASTTTGSGLRRDHDRPGVGGDSFSSASRTSSPTTTTPAASTTTSSSASRPRRLLRRPPTPPVGRRPSRRRQRLAAANNLTLGAEGMPSNQFGIFVVSPRRASTPASAARQRQPLPERLHRPLPRPGQSSPPEPPAPSAPDRPLGDPQGAGTVPTTAGQTWNFQAWYRDGRRGRTSRTASRSSSSESPTGRPFRPPAPAPPRSSPGRARGARLSRSAQRRGPLRRASG